MKRKRWITRPITLLLAGILSVAALTACGGSAPATESGKQAESAVTTTEKKRKTVRDMAGREVQVPEKINSIATFGAIGVINAFVELMGDGDKIANEMTEGFTKSDKWAMQYEFAPQIKNAPVLQNADGEIQIEKVLEVNPDLCLVMSKDLIEPLEKLGMSVVYFDWRETDEVKTAVTLLGETLNKQDVAKDYLAYFDGMVSEAGTQTATLAEEDKKKVLYGNITQFTQPHIIAEWWIETAGGISVTKDSWGNENRLTYTKEDILSWNPDVMIVSDRKMIDEILNDALYADVSAVQNKAVYYIPTVAHVWGNRTVEQPLTVFWTMHKLYPELVTRDQLAEKVSYFYDHFYKYKLSEDQLAKIID